MAVPAVHMVKLWIIKVKVYGNYAPQRGFIARDEAVILDI
jgi:hypothetical protein